MAELLKHVGKYGDKPCVVVFRELPDDSENALIVVSDTLEGQLHDDVMSVVDSQEGQESNSISDVLFRRRLSDGENMLEALHSRKKLTKVPVNMVTLTPLPNQSVPLEEVNQDILSVNPINDSMNVVRKTLEDAVSMGGKMNSQDALEITKAMSTYRAPLLTVEKEFPSLAGDAKKAKMAKS